MHQSPVSYTHLKLKMALLPFKLRIKTIEPQDYSQPIGYLAGVKEVSQVQIPSALIPQEQMEKEMLILAGITDVYKRQG